MKYIELVRARFSKEKVFSMRDLMVFLRKQKISRNYAYLLVHNLLKKKEIHRLSKGVYSFKNDLEVSGFAFSPFYYGLQDALSYRNLWEQESMPVIITPRKIRSGIRKIMDSNVLIKRISRKMFFGFELIKAGNYWLPVSTPEKTLIDFIYFNEFLSKETLNELLEKSDKKTLKEFIKKLPQKTKEKMKKRIQLI